MEVMDSPLNQAHHYGRKADQLVAKEKFEEAILCHSKAAELLTEASSMTQSEQVRLSLELQRDRHLQQQRLIRMSCKQAKLKGNLLLSPSKHSSALITQCTNPTALQSPPLGWKAAKDDKTRLEEQSTAIADLWKLVAVLLVENKRLLEEHEKLKAENASLKRDLYEEHQSPPASIDQPSTLGMRLLDVPLDLQQEIQLLLEMANES
ncbi:nuclear receptor-binding factor 2-like protein [Labeo rohita]|uniref:Nuclear receptor-binding factor 2-like protein n=1 Tax=Labeo rohita TaxID=84645 RepID=A0A498LW14_LABRO|nr:nuclear receptor binding factor 2a [Labeo rohita]RXN11346.1 nuclear receptor-binding factor 2-like protein [Labeo rohita]